MSNEGPSARKLDRMARHQTRTEGQASALASVSSSAQSSRTSHLVSGSNTRNTLVSDRSLRGDTTDTPPLHLGAHHGQAGWPRPPNDDLAEASTASPAPGGMFHSPPLNARYGSIHVELPEIVNYGPVYNIGTAENVFTGVNYGSVTMISDSKEFMANLPTRLKISVQADHRYYASEDEAALLRSFCTPGTRVAIIEFIIRWATDMSPGSEPVYWLSGQAGAGKTTIAFTISYQFDALVRQGNNRVMLGGSFFCSRQFSETRSASSIVRTIVYQLALRSKHFRTALKEHGRFETVHHGPRSQFMGLLIEPWKISAPGRMAENEPCYVIPLDALDELEGNGGTEFLGTLFDVLEKADLPGLKFLVTSRSDPALVTRIRSFPSKQVCRLEEVPLEESSADIKLFLEESLAECATTQQIQRLVSDAAGLFVYAATVVKYIKGRTVTEQKNLLKRLLAASPPSARRTSLAATATLDSVYLQILETSLVDPRDRENPEVFQDCLSLLHTFLCTIERTSATVAGSILNASDGNGDVVFEVGTAEGVLHRLHAVLYSQNGQVMWFHKSFFDFLFDKGRSQRFFCNQEQHHRRLANGCFKVMAEQLRFNIANIPSSYQLDSGDLSLPTRIDVNISRPLTYACANWSGHLTLASYEAPDCIADQLNKFLRLRILFWMESMNLLGERGRCHGMLRDAQQWSLKLKGSAKLVSKLSDAAAFAAYHSTSKAALSTPHLYLSSLATFPRRSAIVQKWRQQFSGIPQFIVARGTGSEVMVASIAVGDKVTALALSPDGTNIAAGLPDGLVRLWNLSTGEDVKVLQGSTSGIRAIAYSPDGLRIVSGSSDRSVRVWDVSTGGEAMVFKGHLDTINSVAYSHDGTYVISGSSDNSIRLWDLSMGEEARVLRGHSQCVKAVACSPDGTRVVSGSLDKSIRVWDPSTGQEVRVITGHTHWVTAVAYSPHGTHIISGSRDLSVRVLDLLTGDNVMILKGHTDCVNAVAYSPDGMHIVSGSDDKTIRVWDLSTGQEARVLKGHANSVGAVTYSSDGTHVVSGSDDKSVRVWDLSTGTREDVTVLKGHTGWARTVAYSPDGKQVVSGSDDASVRVWDLSTGKDVVVLKNHTGWVWGVAYSPYGRRIVSVSDDKSVRVSELSTMKEVRVLRGHIRPVFAVAYSPDGTHVVSGSDDKSVRVWDLFTGKEDWVLNGHTDWVQAVAYSPDGAHVVSGSDDQSLRLWDLSTGEETRIFNGHTNYVRAVAYSPDGAHVVSGSFDNSVRVWNISTGEEVRVFKGHTDSVTAVAYSPDGTCIVSGSHSRSIRVWDLSTGENNRGLKGHTDWVLALAFSPDGKHIVSGSRDKSVRVWNISSAFSPRYIRQKNQDGMYTGWLLSPTDPSTLLMFVPPAALLPDDCNVLALPTSAVPHLSFLNAKLGETWAECYTPSSL